jgi:hypothetical protein
MKALRVGEPPEELRSLEDLPQFIDRVGRFLEEVYG